MIKRGFKHNSKINSPMIALLAYERFRKRDDLVFKNEQPACLLMSNLLANDLFNLNFGFLYLFDI